MSQAKSFRMSDGRAERTNEPITSHQIQRNEDKKDQHSCYPTSPLPASQYAQVLGGITPNRVCGVDSEEVDWWFEEFLTPIGTQTEAEIGCVASTTTENKNKGNLSKLLFIDGVITNCEASLKVSASESHQKTAEGPLLQPEWVSFRHRSVARTTVVRRPKTRIKAKYGDFQHGNRHIRIKIEANKHKTKARLLLELGGRTFMMIVTISNEC
jgi:hypothetical protein